MTPESTDFWTDETSVLFTSYWDWTPETWGTVGWTGEQGLTHRTRLLETLSDPFVVVVYVTGTPDGRDDMAGKVAGCYLVSHETGHRNDFTHPLHYGLSPNKWEHSLKALRAFTYVPEHRLRVADVNPDLLDRAMAVSRWGEVLTDRNQIALLRETPWVEVDVYRSGGRSIETDEELTLVGGVGTRAGPANREGYVVSSSAQQLKRQLYILCLWGNTDAYVGRAVNDRQIYKVGLSFSPELRTQALNKAMPKGAFRWYVHCTSGQDGMEEGFSFEAAVAGEDAMKKHLASKADWLGGEFYLADDVAINTAWRLGCTAARKFKPA